MKAVRITEPGGPEVLKLGELPAPEPGPSEVQVRVRATALNRADLLQIMGLYPAPPGFPADVPGLEYAGEVTAVGAKAQRFQVGDRVMGLVGSGAFAEQVVVHEREAIRIPDGMDFTQAAAIPEAFITAYDALVLQGGLRGAETVLIHAVASGVGTAGSQLAAAFGATVIGTARTAEKLVTCKALGVHHGVLVSGEPAFADEVRALSGGRGVDVVLDLVGGNYLEQTIQALAPLGRIIVVGLMGGMSAEVNLAALLGKRGRLFATSLRSRGVEEKIGVALALERQVLPLFARGLLRPVIDTVLPMAEIQRGFARMAENATVGKVVLTWA